MKKNFTLFPVLFLHMLGLIAMSAYAEEITPPAPGLSALTDQAPFSPLDAEEGVCLFYFDDLLSDRGRDTSASSPVLRGKTGLAITLVRPDRCSPRIPLGSPMQACSLRCTS